MELNFNHVTVADHLLCPPIVIRVDLSVKESKSCAVFVSDCDRVIFSFTDKVSETDPDGVALRNPNSLDGIIAVRVFVMWVVG